MSRGRTFLLNPNSTITGSGSFSGSSGQVAYFGGTNSISGDSAFLYDPSLNFLQLGTTTAGDGGFLSLPNPGGTGEYMEFRWSSNEARIGTTTTGTARVLRMGTGGLGDIQLSTNSTVRWVINTTSGSFVPLTTDTAGIGSANVGIKQLFAGFTDMSGGVTGNQTISKMAGSVNFAASANTVVVTNTYCTTSSKVFAQISTSGSTGVIRSVTPANGSFAIVMATNPATETRVQWWLLNTN